MNIRIIESNPDGVLLDIRDIHCDTYDEAFKIVKAVEDTHKLRQK